MLRVKRRAVKAEKRAGGGVGGGGPDSSKGQGCVWLFMWPQLHTSLLLHCFLPASRPTHRPGCLGGAVLLLNRNRGSVTFWGSARWKVKKEWKVTLFLKVEGGMGGGSVGFWCPGWWWTREVLLWLSWYCCGVLQGGKEEIEEVLLSLWLAVFLKVGAEGGVLVSAASLNTLHNRLET